MHKKLIFISFVGFALIEVSSCTKDFVSVDLSKQSVNIMAPANNVVATSYSQTFWWEELEGADKYNLQIVKPSFAAIQNVILDTLVKSHQFAYTLQPGVYQWRLRAQNNASKTDWVVRTLTIDSSQNLSGQTLLLISPVDNFFTNNLVQNFSWFAMPNATGYVFQIVSQSGVPIGNPQSITTTATTNTFSIEGTYKWRVYAQNNLSVSPYAERTIIIDTTAPAVPFITFLPLNDTTTSNPIHLSWNSVESSATYRVLISSDSTFGGVIKDTLTSNIFYNFYNSTTGHYYYWKIRAIDVAGNMSVYCIRRRIKRM